MGFNDENSYETVVDDGALAVPPSLEANMGTQNLGDFLSRPVKILELQWTSGLLGSHFDPWALFLNDVFVGTKIDYFSRLRGNLHLRFMINGTPFHYGRLMMSYVPTFGKSQFPETNLFRNSQVQNVMMCPCSNQTQEMVLPFFSPVNWIELQNATGAYLGVVNYNPFVGLNMSNSAVTSAVTVTVYAWMENVELTMPTLSVSATFTAQSDTDIGDNLMGVGNAVAPAVLSSGRADEFNGDRPISAVASAVARATGMLGNVPIIGQYATAASFLASSMSSVAAYFGFSRPTLIEAPSYMKKIPFSPLAPTAWKDTSYKLSMDLKQETTVDHSVLGLPRSIDHMSFEHIGRRWSYITQWSWATTQTPGTILEAINVCPIIEKEVLNGLNYENNPSALSFIARPFDRWTGDLEYKFIVVASGFHRGRLRVSYDPLGNNFVDDTSNVLLSQIIDISSTTEIDMTVGWTKAEPWASNERIEFDALYDADTCNGQITISVLNELASPDATKGATVMMFIRMGKGTQFAVPRVIDNDDYLYYEPQGDMEDCGEVLSVVLAGSPQIAAAASLVNYGESFSSFRPYVKRFGYFTTMNDSNLAYGNLSTQLDIMSYRLPHWPFAPGASDREWSSSSELIALTPVAYVAGAFAAIRGSARWKLQAFGGGDYEHFGQSTMVTRVQDTHCGEAQTNDFALVGNIITVKGVILDYLKNAIAGSLIDYSGVDNGIEFEIPFYNRCKFNTDLGLSTSYNYPEDFDRPLVSHMLRPVAAGLSNAWINRSDMVFGAAGDDFSCAYFLGAPTYWTIA